MDVVIEGAAQEALQSLQRKLRDRAIAKIEQYAADPRSQANNVSAFKGHKSGLLRLRVGRIRVIFVVRDGRMEVLDIGLRGQIY